MFEKTRRSLTVFFSLMLALILLLLTVLFYVVLCQTLERNENAVLDGLYDKSLQELEHRKKDALNHRPGPSPIMDRKGPDIHFDLDFVQANQFLSIIDKDGSFVFGNWNDDETRTFWSDWLNHNPKLEGKGQSKQTIVQRDDSIYAVKLFPWSDNNGYLLTALNISDNEKLINQMRLMLVLLFIFLLLIASGAGYLLAGRAMIPIARAFQRQQDFTADASHELRTPLSVLQSSVEILAEERESLPPFHRKVLNNMDEEVHRMIRLTESLLTLARSDSNAVELDRKPTDVIKLASEAMEKMRPLAERKEMDFQLVIADHSIRKEAIVDEDRIQQLLVILLDNAIKYTPAGGSVRLEAAVAEKGVELAVVDSGIGIAADQIPYIFERFYRSDKARSRQAGGTGLGLSIAKWIAQAHKGSIKVESELGRGSRFAVFIPEES